MNLNGGILIIGSLIWDDSTIRKSWRNGSLNTKDRIKIKVPIRYGRISRSRMNTYTMVFSSSIQPDEYGGGILLKFLNPVTSIDSLKTEAESIIRVERDKTKEEWKIIKDSNPFVLNWSWGVLGLCINPKYIENNIYAEEIKDVVSLWKKCLSDFDHTNYSLKGEDSFITEEGIFNVDWNHEMKGMDFFVATIIKPNLDEYPIPEDIAKKMYEGKYYSYFINNVENEIGTKDDPKILELLKDEYSISSYIKKEIDKQ